MFESNKKDPLVESVKKTIVEGNLRREVVRQINEKLDIHSRVELPHQHVDEYDSIVNNAIYNTLNEGKVVLDNEILEGFYKDKLVAKNEKKRLQMRTIMRARKRDEPEDGTESVEQSRKMAKKKNPEKAKDFGESIEEETLDEVSVKTLKSYIKKADKDARVQVSHRKIYQNVLSANQEDGPVKYVTQNTLNIINRKIKNRVKGLNTAARKETDKKLALAPMKRLRKEETLNELSGKTLGSYVKKAAEQSQTAEHLLGAGRKSTKLTKMANKRASGINKAVDKMVKKTTNEETKQDSNKKKMIKVSVTRPIGYKIADIGKGGKEHNVVKGVSKLKEETLEEANEIKTVSAAKKAFASYNKKFGYDKKFGADKDKKKVVKEDAASRLKIANIQKKDSVDKLAAQNKADKYDRLFSSKKKTAEKGTTKSQGQADDIKEYAINERVGPDGKPTLRVGPRPGSNPEALSDVTRTATPKSDYEASSDFGTRNSIETAAAKARLDDMKASGMRPRIMKPDGGVTKATPITDADKLKNDAIDRISKRPYSEPQDQIGAALSKPEPAQPINKPRGVADAIPLVPQAPVAPVVTPTITPPVVTPVATPLAAAKPAPSVAPTRSAPKPSPAPSRNSGEENWFNQAKGNLGESVESVIRKRILNESNPSNG